MVTSVETDASTATDTDTVTQTSLTSYTQTTTLPPVTYTTTVQGSVTTVTSPGVVTTIVTTDTIVETDTETDTETDVITQTVPAPTTVTKTLPGVVTTISGTPVTLPGVVTTVTASVSYAVSRLSTCAAPTPSAVEGAAQPQPTDYTWGCPPGTICAPRLPLGCDIFADPPARSYVCAPSDCYAAPPFTPVTWPEGETAYYPLTPGYPNLSPLAFGLSYDIFSSDVVVEVVDGRPVATVTTGNWASQATITAAYTPAAAIAKRAPLTVPSVCFAICNNALSVGVEMGKTPALCATGSSFLSYVSACRQCTINNGDVTQKSLKPYVEPQFAQWIEFCDARDSESVVSPGGGGESQGGGGGGVTTEAPGDPTSGAGVPVEPTTWRNSTMTTSSRVPTEPTETGGEPTETGGESTETGGEPTKTSGGGGGPMPSTSQTAFPSEGRRGVGGGIGGLVALVMFVVGVVAFAG